MKLLIENFQTFMVEQEGQLPQIYCDMDGVLVDFELFSEQDFSEAGGGASICTFFTMSTSPLTTKCTALASCPWVRMEVPGAYSATAKKPTSSLSSETEHSLKRGMRHRKSTFVWMFFWWVDLIVSS